jgi:hypothetical protein
MRLGITYYQYLDLDSGTTVTSITNLQHVYKNFVLHGTQKTIQPKTPAAAAWKESLQSSPYSIPKLYVSMVAICFAPAICVIFPKYHDF